MDGPYRIMFVIRIPGEKEHSICVGVNFDNACLFSILLYSPNDKIQLDYNTSHYPKELLLHLEKEKDLIDSGWHDIRTWEMTIFENNLKERKVFNMNQLKDRGIKNGHLLNQFQSNGLELSK